MDALLAKLGSHAVNYAIRSGIAITSTYAVNQCSRLLKTVDDRGVYTELKKLQKLLDSKIKVGGHYYPEFNNANPPSNKDKTLLANTDIPHSRLFHQQST